MKFSRRIVLCAAMAPLGGCAAQRQAAIPPRMFFYEDVHRYAAAISAIQNGADPVSAMQAYLDGASEGMQTWLGIYPADAAQLAAQYQLRPRYYASLASMPGRMAALEPEIAQAYARLEAMHAGADLGGVYYLVGRYTAGGTARRHSMVAIEFFGRTPQTDMSEFADNPTLYDLNELAQVVVHEGVHSLQRHIQGMDNYISIYVNAERMTMRNFAIREGAADYVAELVLNRRMTRRQGFGEDREAEIWAEFAPLMNQTIFEQPGWFQGRFADGREWPNQMGYFVGYKMAQYVHQSASDRDAALMEILSPYTDEQFAAIAARYAAKF